jgi:hypothetical protein
MEPLAQDRDFVVAVMDLGFRPAWIVFVHVSLHYTAAARASSGRRLRRCGRHSTCMDFIENAG